MTIRSYVRITSFVLTLIIVLGASSIINMNNSRHYKMQLENSYQQSLNELSESLDSIETDLTKSIYSNSDKMLLDISSSLYSECEGAKEALSRLPVGQMNLSSTYRFISQSADFANYIANKIASGEKVSEKEHKNLSTLLHYAQSINDSVSTMVSVCNNGGKITGSNVKNSKNIQVNALSTDMSSVEKAFKNYPTLLYDGPFADAVLNRSASLIKDQDSFNKDEAQKIAATALNCNEKQLNFEGEDKGTIPCYTFSCGQRTIGVTKQGGYIAYILYGGKISKSAISEENARNIAKSYLDKLGYENMKETYYMCDNNVLVVNFAYSQKDVVCYSDLVKVGVSMADGKIVSLEAEGYITNHIERDEFKSGINLNDAQKKLSPYLTVLDSKKCIIPLENGLEAQCYEFHCESQETGEEVLVYVNSETGVEENILLLLYSDGGTLTK